MSKNKHKLADTMSSNLVHEKSPIIYWIAMSIVVLFLFIAPFQTALFNGYTPQYEVPIYSSILAGSLLLILLAIYFFYNWRLENTRDLLSIYIWLVPLTYWVSTFAAASSHLSKNMAYIHMMYATLFVFGLYIAKNKLGAAVIQLSITLSGYAVVLYGIAAMFGNAYFRDAVMLTDQGYRLTSVFQYANAYAAFLMAILLACLYYIVHSKKQYAFILHSLMLVPILLSFWLTLSRGGIVTFPVIFLCILPLLSLIRQLALTLYSCIALAFVFPIIKTAENKSTEIVKQILNTVKPDGTAATLGWFDSRSLSGWGLVIASSVLASAVIFLLNRFAVPALEKKLRGFSSRKYSRIAFPAFIAAAGFLVVFLLFSTGVKDLLPDTLQKRIENINFNQHSVLERGTFYKDSIKLVKDYPLIGAGGGGWATLYEKYQNNPYVSRQAHNFFLQYLVEAGTIGFLVLIILLATVFFLYIRKNIKAADEDNNHLVFYFVAVSLLIHSILDFEMSYVFLGALVFICLGGMSSILSEKPKILGGLGFIQRNRFLYPSFISVVALAFFILSYLNLNSNKLYNEAISRASGQSSLQEVLQPLDQAIKLQPDNLNYLVNKMSFLRSAYTQSKNEKLYEDFTKVAHQAKQLEPNNRSLLEENYSAYILKNQYEDALQLMNEAIKDRPWEISFYERAISLNVELWKQAQAKNPSGGDKYWNSALETYQTVQAKTKELEKLPKGQEQGRPFNITPVMDFQIGHIVFIKGDIPKATEYLQRAAAAANLDQQIDTSELERRRTHIRWYLAALIKQNKMDQALYDKLIAGSSDEKQKIDALVHASF